MSPAYPYNSACFFGQARQPCLLFLWTACLHQGLRVIPQAHPVAIGNVFRSVPAQEGQQPDRERSPIKTVRKSVFTWESGFCRFSLGGFTVSY
jgi:hypothetical protein